MNAREFKESQKDCAKMLGMTLNEYIDFCKNLKVSHNISVNDSEDKTKKLMDYFGITNDMLKKERYNEAIVEEIKFWKVNQ